MSRFQVLLLVGYALGMAGGQLLFKLASQSVPAAGGPERLLALLYNPPFLCAVVLYGALTFLWVWILSFTPLSQAYVFVAVAFAVTPLLAALIFKEQLEPTFFLGLALILAGLFFVVR